MQEISFGFASLQLLPALLVLLIPNTTADHAIIYTNNIIVKVVIIVIRIEILQGASLGMGSLHHIKVIGSDIESRDYNNNIQKYCM